MCKCSLANLRSSLRYIFNLIMFHDVFTILYLLFQSFLKFNFALLLKFGLFG